MKVGEVWVLRCVGHLLYTLIVGVDDHGVDILDLEEGIVRRWMLPALGNQVGEWHRWAHEV